MTGATVSEFLQSRIHQAFTTAADQLFAMGFFTTQERIDVSSCIGDALEAFTDIVQEKVPNVVDIEVPIEVARDILRNAVLRKRQGIVKVAQDNIAVPIRDEGRELRERGEFYSTLVALVELALGDERHAISVYDAAIDAMDPGDPNRAAFREILDDERDHEKVLLRMLGEDIPIRTAPTKLPGTEEALFQELIGSIGQVTKTAALFNMEELREKADQMKEGVTPRTLAVDFDGTISEYDGFQGVGVFGRPIDGAKQILNQFKDDGWYIIIDTCRGEVPQIVEYLISFEIPFDEVNSNKYQPETANSSIHFNGDWTSIYTEVLKREKEKEYSPLEAVKITANSGGAFAYDPQKGILLDFTDPMGHRTQPQDYPDPVTWGNPKELKKKREKKRREKGDNDSDEDIRPTGSVLDYPRNALDPAIWEYEEGVHIPKLRPEVKDVIVKEFEDWAELVGVYTNPEDWIKDYLFIGSSATVQWKDTSDIDITVIVDQDALDNAEIIPDDIQADGTVAEWLGIQVALGLNGFEISKHPVNYWIASDEKPIDMADAIYDLYTDTWIKPPPEFPEIFDPEEAFTDTWSEAKNWANKFDLEISETRRDINDFVDLHSYNKQAGAYGLQLDELAWINTKLEAKRAEIGQDVRNIINDFKQIYEQKQQAFTAPVQAVPEGRMYFSRNWLPAVLIWKWLEKYNYLELLKDIMQLYKEVPTDVITEEKVWKLKEVLA